MNNNIKYQSFLFAVAVGLASCTEPGEMTQISAAAGGVMGAGLGAIIGSQTGDAGTGLVIGTVAGAATGAAVGNVLQAQDETIKSQDEAIERQQQLLAANQRELHALKAARDDSQRVRSFSEPKISDAETAPRASFRSANSMNTGKSAYYEHKQTKTIKRHDKLTDKGSVSAKKTTTLSAVKSEKSTFKANESIDVNTSTTSIPAKSEGITERDITQKVEDSSVAAIPESNHNTTTEVVSDDCSKAATEVEKADASKEIADKLFHYRRALRLCPNNALYHNLLGETYVSLNRNVDAEFEFREAIKLDPNMLLAKKNLDSLR